MQTQIIWLKDYYCYVLTKLAHGRTEKNSMILF